MARCSFCGHDLGAKRHGYFPGDLPYGLKPKEGNPREYEKDYDEIATIDTICHRYRQGDGIRAIARWLDGIGVKSRKGGPFAPSTVARILRREGLM